MFYEGSKIEGSGGGGGSAVIESLSVTPTTSAQTIRAPSGTDGYSPVNVSAVTAAIDNNISAENIVSGVSILGVNGSAIELNATTESVTPTTSSQTVTPTSPYNGFSSVTVNGVTAAIDNNITAGNIKDGVTILGVTGSYTGGSANIDSLSITPTTSSQTITASGGVDGYSPITVSAVTSSIDANIQAGNIKKDVTILGVTGSYEGSGGGSGGSSRAFNANFVVDTSGNVTNFGYGKTQGVLAYNATSISENEAYKQVYRSDTTLRLVDLSSLTTISGGKNLDNAFAGCTNLTSVDLSSLTTVETMSFNNAFPGCTNLTSVDLSSLTTVGTGAFNNAFYGCTKLTSVDLSSLTTVDTTSFNNAFYGCTALTDIYFRALTTSSFDSYTDQFNSMMRDTGSTVTHTIHFPSNMESTISGLDGYPLFGGESGYVVLAFDLPATE